MSYVIIIIMNVTYTVNIKILSILSKIFIQKYKKTINKWNILKSCVLCYTQWKNTCNPDGDVAT